MKFVKLIIIGIIALFSTSILFAQIGVGLNGGAMIYNGDFRGQGANIGYGLTLDMNISPAITIQGQVLSGGLKASSDYHSLTTKVFEYGVNTIINFMPKSNVSLYFLMGIGLTNFEAIKRSTVDNTIVGAYGYKPSGNKNSDAAPSNAPAGFGDIFNYWQTDAVVPLGLGFKFRLSDKLDLGIGATLRIVNTDLLDVSDERGNTIISDPDPALRPTNITKPSLLEMDKYTYASVSLTYVFGRGAKPPSEKEHGPISPSYEEPVVASNLPEEFIPADSDSDDYISTDEIYAVIDAFFEGETDFTVDRIYALIDFFFEQ